jgi:hypothetical protein
MKRNIKLALLTLTLLSFMEFNIFAIEFIVPSTPHGVTIADVNQNGSLDVIVGSRKNTGQDTISIFYNNGYGNFEVAYLEKEILQYIYCIPINNDNYPDIVTQIFDNYQIVYYENLGDSNFGDAIPIHSTLFDHNEAIRIADINNNGRNDIVLFRRSSFGIHYWGILKNNGGGGFTEQLFYTTDLTIPSLQIGFIDDDVLPDIIIPVRDIGARIFYNNYPYFTQIDFYTNDIYSDVFLDDFNNDGLTDIVLFQHLFLPGSTCKFDIYYNLGNGTFSPPDTIIFPNGTVIGDINDYNNDGYPDITYFCGTWTEVDNFINVCLNNGDGTFAEPTSYYMGQPFIFYVTSADLDGNGFLDLIVTGYTINNIPRLKILFNDGTGNFFEEPQVGINDELIVTSARWELINYPNPFNPSTTIQFSSEPFNRNEQITLEIYNIKGQKIRQLNIQNSQFKMNEVVWDSRNQFGDMVTSGIYLYRIKTNNFFSQVKRMLLIK